MASVHGRGILGSDAGDARDRLWLVGIAGVTALVFAAFASGSTRLAVVGSGAVAGAVGLAILLTVAPGRVVDLLFFALALLVPFPVDKYFDYHAHVGGWPGLRLSSADLVMYVLLPIALLTRALDRGVRGLPGAVVLILGLTLAQYALSTLGSRDRALSVFQIAATVHSATVAWAAAVLFRRRHLYPIVTALAVLVCVHTAFAVAQAATGRPIGAGVLGGNASVMKEALTTGTDFLRPSGLFVHPIVYADFLFLTIPIVAAGAMAVRSTSARLALGGAVLFGLGGLALTLARGAWIASIVVSAMFVFLGLRRRLLDPSHLKALAKLAAIGGLVLAVGFGPRIYDRLTDSKSGNLDVRFELNWIALRMIENRPLLGQGLNTFVESMSPFDPKDVESYFPAPAHNLYLLEAAESGLPALVLLLALFATILTVGLRAIPRLQDPALAWLEIALVSGVCGLMVSQLADFSMRLEPLTSTIWFLFGLLFGVAHAATAPARAHALEPAPSGMPATVEDLA
jgi:hypothetical protein